MNGAEFEQHLLVWWGREGKVGSGVLQSFVDLAKRHSWEKVYDGVKKAGEMNKKSYAYVRGILEDKDGKPKTHKRLAMLCRCSACDQDVPEYDYNQHIQNCEAYKALPMNNEALRMMLGNGGRGNGEIKSLGEIMRK